MTDAVIFKGSSGLNNRVNGIRQQYNSETGIGLLQEAINVDISDTGQVSRRLGQVQFSDDSFMTVFCDEGDCFALENRDTDSAIMQVGTDLSLTGIRSSLAKDAMMSFCQVGTKTYYSNGYQNGVIENNISNEWPDYVHLGGTTEKKFYAAPLGTHLAYFDGYMLIAEDNVIWISEKYEVGKFRMKNNLFQMGTNVRMIKPVLNGLWVSDEDKIGFVPAGNGHLRDSSFMQKAAFPAHEWSDCIELIDLKDTHLQLSGLSAVWSSDEGLCVGSEDGQLYVTTKEELFYSTGSSGATVFDGFNVINNVY